MTDTHLTVTPINAGATVAAIIPRTIEEVWRISQLVVLSGMAPKDIDIAEKAAVIIMHGAEVGLPPMVALQSIAVINGRPSLYGDGLLAVVRKSGVLDRITETSHEIGTDGEFARCTVTRGGQRVTREFSKKQAIVAGLWGRRGRGGEPTPWVTYPSRMLQMRARAFALRDVFSDILKGLASREELEDVAGNGGGAVSNSPPPPPPPAEPEPTPIEEAIAKAKTKKAAKPKSAEPKPAEAVRDLQPPAPPPEENIIPEIIPEGEGVDPSDQIMLWEETGERPAAPEDLR